MTWPSPRRVRASWHGRVLRESMRGCAREVWLRRHLSSTPSFASVSAVIKPSARKPFCSWKDLTLLVS